MDCVFGPSTARPGPPSTWGGEYTWGDCMEVRRCFERLKDEGILPADGNLAASYSGNVNFALAAVPEPSPVALLLAGMAAIGWLIGA